MKKYFLISLLILSTYILCVGQQLKSYKNGSIELFYEEMGKGPAIYILSGGPGEAPEYPYRLIVDSLKSYYTCILLHQRGSGKSRNLPINEVTITIENYTQDIELLRKYRGDKKITLFGISWGGLLAMNYTALYPENVSNLILVSSAPPSYKLWNVLFDNQFARRSTIERDSMALLYDVFRTKSDKELDSLKRVNPNSKEVTSFKEFIDLHVRAMYYDRNNISKKRINDLFYNFNFQPISIIDKEVIETKWDISAKLKKLEIPVLIIYGRQDDQGESTFYLQKECFKINEMHVIEQCGHHILDEQPSIFFNILMDYVKRSRS